MKSLLELIKDLIDDETRLGDPTQLPIIELDLTAQPYELTPGIQIADMDIVRFNHSAWNYFTDLKKKNNG